MKEGKPKSMPELNVVRKENRLEDELVSEGLLTREQLALAEVTHRTLGGDLSQVLVQKGFLKEDKLLDFFSKTHGIPSVSLKGKLIPQTLLRLVPYQTAQHFTLVPYDRDENTLTIAVADPFNLKLIDQELNCEGLKIKAVLAHRKEIEEAIKEFYKVHRISNQQKAAEVEIITAEKLAAEHEHDKVEEIASSMGVVTAVNSILESAYESHASDIHIEPQKDFLRVRCRIDGCLEETHILPTQMMLPIVSRVKIISGMNIAEKRSPQDGRFTVKIHADKIDCRTSSYPTVYGEKVVIRLLTKGSLKRLENLGMSEIEVENFRQAILRPHGLILVTGPTGSGKSTTLYAALQLLNSIDRNILSIEDPVENEIVGVNQAQVNNKANMTFASALRSMLRQDPDVIMVGEVRDPETAEMCVKAALTGHLVFSTLHTNTSVGAVSRLLNLGIPPFLLSSSLIAVLGQRLVRRLCPNCKIEIEPDTDMVKLLKFDHTPKTFKGKGCEQCRQSGFSSRVGIFELFKVEGEVRIMIEKGSTDEEIWEYVYKEKGFYPMVEDGRRKVEAGVTTLTEVLRVTEAF